MYTPNAHDRVHFIAVWSRAPWKPDRYITVKIYRRTRTEAVAFVIGLGYLVVDA